MMRGPRLTLALLAAQRWGTAALLRGTSREEPPVDWRQHGRDWNEGNCQNRDASSPINFDDFETPQYLNKRLEYNFLPITGNFNLVNDGFTVHADMKAYDPDLGGIIYEGAYHALTRIDFHSGSEHTFKGQHLPLEIQFTLQKKNSPSIVIVCVLVEAPDRIETTTGAPPALLQERAWARRAGQPVGFGADAGDLQDDGGDGVGNAADEENLVTNDVTDASDRASEDAEVESGEEVLRRDAEEEREEHDVPYDPPPLGKVQPNTVIAVPPAPGRSELYTETGLTPEDVNGMTDEVLGHTPSPELVKEEDMDEIKFVDELDEGANYTGSHPDFDRQWRKQGVRGPRRPHIRQPPAQHSFGLAAVRRATRAGAGTGLGEPEEPEEEIEVYTPPNSGDPDWSDAVQHFIMTSVPEFEASAQVNQTAAKPLYLNDFFYDSTWFEYGGTRTLPPCQKATFLVRRETFKASTAQVSEFFRVIHASSSNAGNYRTLMPRNSRVIMMRKSQRNTGIPPSGQAEAIKTDAQRIFRAKRTAQDAATIADTAANYARGLDQRLKRAAVAHVLALPRTVPPPEPEEPPPPGLPYSTKWLDPEIVSRALGSSAGSHARAVAEAVAAHAAEEAAGAGHTAANLTAEAWLSHFDPAALGSASPAGAPPMTGPVTAEELSQA